MKNKDNKNSKNKTYFKIYLIQNEMTLKVAY